MNRYLKLVLPSMAAIALVGTPTLAQAQSTAPNQQRQERRQDLRQKLNLSEDQKKTMQQIREETKAKIRGVLDQDQLAKFDAAQQQNPKEKRGVLRSLNLRTDQQEKIRGIMQESREKMRGVLTQEQRDQIEKFRQSHRRQKTV
jgi:periplasmic protein CpxP/Spy